MGSDTGCSIVVVRVHGVDVVWVRFPAARVVNNKKSSPGHPTGRPGEYPGDSPRPDYAKRLKNVITCLDLIEPRRTDVITFVRTPVRTSNKI